jgi:hypothetical protein
VTFGPPTVAIEDKRTDFFFFPLILRFPSSNGVMDTVTGFCSIQICYIRLAPIHTVNAGANLHQFAGAIVQRFG